jgi:tRNA (cytidine/uridine-2'-O-)-methyltransferase
MDYWKEVRIHRHVSYDDFVTALDGRRIWLFSARGERSFWDAPFSDDDVLLFGPESRGLPPELLERSAERVLRIPIRAETRSLNLASAAAIALYEALRQTGSRPG